MKVVVVSLLTIALVCPASAGQYAKTDLSLLGLSYAQAVSPDGRYVVGRAPWTVGAGITAFWERGVGLRYVLMPSGLPAGAWVQLVNNSGEMYYSRNEQGVKSVWQFNANTGVHTTLPNPLFPGLNGTASFHRLKDSNRSGSILGYQKFNHPSGETFEEPVVWHRNGDNWSPHWIRGSSGFVYGLDDANNVFGQSSAGMASIWDSDLLRTDLRMPTGFTGGKAHGRLRDGRIMGQLWKTGVGWHIATWANETSTPTTSFFGSRTQVEAPALSALDVLFVSDFSPLATHTWSPTEGKQEISSQVIGGLEGGPNAVFAGDGGHLIAYTESDLKYWLLTPVPEPATLAVLALGIGVLAKRRRGS